ncbi:MAG: ribosomal protein S18-alanine N-acetyltransferase [Mycobacteriales bacterium]
MTGAARSTGTAVRAMRWWDIDGGVLALERELFGADSWSPELFWSELADPVSRRYVVAESGRDLAGYGGVSVQSDEAYIQTIAVAPAYQRRGIGRTLLADLLTTARLRGAMTAGLEVRADNAPAQLLYARFGFEPVGIRRGYYQPSNVDAVVMFVEGVGAASYEQLLERSRGPADGR